MKTKYKTGDRVVIPPYGEDFPKLWEKAGIEQSPPATVKSVNSKNGTVFVRFDGESEDCPTPILETNLRPLRKGEK